MELKRSLQTRLLYLYRLWNDGTGQGRTIGLLHAHAHISVVRDFLEAFPTMNGTVWRLDGNTGQSGQSTFFFFGAFLYRGKLTKITSHIH